MKSENTWLQNTLSKLHSLVQEERRIGVEILEILYELERRKAYSELGYDGLYSFCVRELKFTESQSHQRIQAMFALKAVPELKNKIQSGTMSVTTVAQVQVFLRQERVQGIVRDAQEKTALFNQFENKTSQEVKKEISVLKGERIKTKITLELDEEAEQLWREVKSKSAHQSQGDELKLMKMLMRGWLELKSKPVQPRRTISGLTAGLTRDQITHSRHIPAHIRREVIARDQAKCTQCGSHHALQLDHKQPFAKNGSHTTTNLRTLCRNCNLQVGIKHFGLAAMKR